MMVMFFFNEPSSCCCFSFTYFLGSFLFFSLSLPSLSHYQVQHSKPPPLATPTSASASTAPTSDTIFIKNVPTAWDVATAEMRLRHHFQACGEIFDVRVPRHPDGYNLIPRFLNASGGGLPPEFSRGRRNFFLLIRRSEYCRHPSPPHEFFSPSPFSSPLCLFLVGHKKISGNVHLIGVNSLCIYVSMNRVFVCVYVCVCVCVRERELTYV